MGTFLQDLRYGFRTLIKSPGFALTAVLTLALGIGANTAIFTVVNSVLLRPLPYRDPSRLLILSERTAQFESGSVAYQNFTDWKAQSTAFEGMALFRNADYILTGNRGPEQLRAREVSAGFFGVLGVPLAMGRDSQPEDDREGAARTVILSYGLWQRRFGGAPDILGKVLHISDENYTVIGVSGKDFRFYNPSDLFLPIGASGQPWLKNRLHRQGAYCVARLKPGVTRARAQSELDGIAQRLAAAYPEANAGHGITTVPMHDDVVSDVRSSLAALALGVLFLMAIACVNVANLLLSRVVPRQREFAIRTALGASRRRVAAQLLTESVLLALLGGIFGIGLGWIGTQGLLALMGTTLPRAQAVSVDWRVGLFVFVLCMTTGVLFGLGPVWQSLRGNTNETLKNAGRGSSARRHLLQNVLVAAELGIAVLLLAGAGLTVRTLQKLAQVDPGFRPDHVVTFAMGFSREHYNEPAKIRNMLNEVITRLGNIPGVEAASIATDIIMRDDSELQFYVAERPKPGPKDYNWSMFYLASTDYLKTMGIRQIKGRFFNEHDNLSSPGVIVIDEELARTVFPNQDPLGQHLIIPFPGFEQPREIIGVVQHVKHWGLSQDETAKIRSELYVPFAQIPDNLYALVNDMNYAVRSSLDERALTAAIKNELRSLDADIPVYHVSSMNEIISASIAGRRQISQLLGFFALAALLLGAVGTYGVISYSVSQRINEMGIRMALGAQPHDILGLVVGSGARLVAIGIACGLVLSVILTRFMASFLCGVKATDPLTFAGVSLLLFGVAITACLVPARRATKVDPMIALRYE